jgi:hypothetical protein
MNIEALPVIEMEVAKAMFDAIVMCSLFASIALFSSLKSVTNAEPVGAAETDGTTVGAGDGNGDGLAERDGMGVGMDVGVAQLTERVYSPLPDENPSTRST